MAPSTPTIPAAATLGPLALAPALAGDAWSWRIETTVAGEALLLAHRGPAPAARVEVLLDDRPPDDHPAVYGVPDRTATVPPGTELRFAYVLPAGRRPFRTLRVRWVDPTGRLREVRHAVDLPTPVRPTGDDGREG